MTLNAGWHNHHIEGYAIAAIEAGRDGHFQAPLISHIERNLYVGGCIDGVRLEDDFRHVVSLYTWERYALGPDTRLHEYEMYDATEMPDETLLTGIADDVNRYLIEGKTLVHCRAGLNRSNLVAALALIRLSCGRSAARWFSATRRSNRGCLVWWWPDAASGSIRPVWSEGQPAACSRPLPAGCPLVDVGAPTGCEPHSARDWIAAVSGRANGAPSVDTEAPSRVPGSLAPLLLVSSLGAPCVVRLNGSGMAERYRCLSLS